MGHTAHSVLGMLDGPAADDLRFAGLGEGHAGDRHAGSLPGAFLPVASFTPRLRPELQRTATMRQAVTISRLAYRVGVTRSPLDPFALARLAIIHWAGPRRRT